MSSSGRQSSAHYQYTYIRAMRRSVSTLGFLTLCFALTGLVMNALNLALPSFEEAHTTPFTAFGLLLLGFNLFTHRPLQRTQRWKYVLAITIAVLCFARVAEALFLNTSHIENLLSPSSDGLFVGRFGVESASLIGCLILAGVFRRSRGYWGEFFVSMAIGCLLFAGVQQLFSSHLFGGHTSPFSLFAEISGTMAIVGIYSTRRRLRVFFLRSWIGLQARVMAVVVAAVPIFFASVIIFSTNPGESSVEAAVITITVRIMLLLSIVWLMSYRHEKSDEARRRSERNLKRMYRTDILTGVCNRHGAIEFLEAAWDSYQTNEAEFSVFLVDLDHFKQINDRFGHHSGDEVLRHVGSVLKASVRAHDMVGRWGGEEFVVLIARRPSEPSIDIAERLCSAISHMPRPAALVARATQDIRITASIGVSEFMREDQSFEAALERADKSLYEAKANGRNQVIEAPKIAA